MTARRWIRYRGNLTARAQAMRRDPSPAEKKLWFEFLRDRPEKFIRQKPLGWYVADFYCSSHRLVVELDGDTHYRDGDRDYDDRRTAFLRSQGVQVIRFTNSDVLQNFEGVCGVLAKILQTAP